MIYNNSLYWRNPNDGINYPGFYLGLFEEYLHPESLGEELFTSIDTNSLYTGDNGLRFMLKIPIPSYNKPLFNDFNNQENQNTEDVMCPHDLIRSHLWEFRPEAVDKNDLLIILFKSS